MKFQLSGRIVSAVMMLASSSSALAHPFHGMGTGFAAGFTHPFAGLDHLLAMVAVGLWAAQSGGRRRWTIPLIFIASMAAGGMLGFANLAPSLLEPVIAASVLALGLLTVLRARLHAPGILLIALFALFHGAAHGIELPESASALTYAAGFILATGLLHLLGMAAAWRVQFAGRWAGMPIALTGCWLLAATV